MKKKVLLLLAAALFVSLWGCAAREEASSGVVVWYAGDVSVWNGDSKAVSSLPYEGENVTVDSLVAALAAGPEGTDGLLSPLPAGTRLLGWTLENGLLRLDLSAEYESLAGMALTVADYCLTLTLTQLPGVERLNITAEGRVLEQRHRQELLAEQVILSGAEERPVEVSAALYFPRAAGRGLGLETRVLQMTEGEVLAELATLALLAGPENKELSSIIPAGSRLLGIQMEDEVCVVDFSEEFLSAMPEDEGDRLLVIYSIVDTLGNLETVGAVRFLVEGEALTHYGSVALTEPLEPDFGLSGGD